MTTIGRSIYQIEEFPMEIQLNGGDSILVMMDRPFVGGKHVGHDEGKRVEV